VGSGCVDSGVRHGHEPREPPPENASIRSLPLHGLPSLGRLFAWGATDGGSNHSPALWMVRWASCRFEHMRALLPFVPHGQDGGVNAPGRARRVRLGRP